MHHELLIWLYFLWYLQAAWESEGGKGCSIFCEDWVLPSPPKSFCLPVYAETCARQYVALDPKLSYQATTVAPRVLCFVDDCALELDSSQSNSEGSTIWALSTSCTGSILYYISRALLSHLFPAIYTCGFCISIFGLLWTNWSWDQFALGGVHEWCLSIFWISAFKLH